jgi:SNF2 family DNA or RNA helicase
LERYLPPKTEAVVVCRLSPLQCRLYRHIAGLRRFASSSAADAAVLQILNALRKACADPGLLYELAAAEATGNGAEPTKRLALGSSTATSITAAVAAAEPDDDIFVLDSEDDEAAASEAEEAVEAADEAEVADEPYKDDCAELELADDAAAPAAAPAKGLKRKLVTASTVST